MAIIFLARAAVNKKLAHQSRRPDRLRDVVGEPDAGVSGYNVGASTDSHQLRLGLGYSSDRGGDKSKPT